MKAFLLFVLTMFSTYSYSAVNGGTYYVDGFIESTQSAQNLLQVNTGASNSCGPTSLLLIKNYYWMEMFNSPAPYTQDLMSAIREIDDVYDGLGQSYNTTTEIDDLKPFVKNTWDWRTAVKANGNNSIATNLQSMINRIGQDYPVVLALEPDYPYNPVYGYAHIVVFYKYDSNAERLYYFDPYYGYASAFQSIHKNDLASAIQGNLPYLRIAP